MHIPSVAVLASVIISTLAGAAEDDGTLHLVLPTDNDALFRGGGPEFYQYIERDFKGVKSTPWEGGRYGFTRDPIETAAGLIFTRFHEGMDIRPLQRDEKNDPIDAVRAIAAGKVVHANDVPGYSNYGRYVVIEHRWGGASYYSLYGHLRAIAVRVGQEVESNQQIGVMGYTGIGINQARAHVHLELNLMLSHEFEAWHRASYPTEVNHHGLFNGINLTGLDIAALYLALRKDPSLTIPKFLAREEPFYTVGVPRSQHFELPRLYPWMVTKSATPQTRSWEVSFDRSGLPLKIEASPRQVSQPELIHVNKSAIDCTYLTRSVVAGRGGRANLTNYGRRLMRLLVFPD